MYTDKENITACNITDVMEKSYISYSMSVIVARALPDARDGLKPVQRRVMYAMHREGLLYSRAYDKCAGVVGEVLKNYHPHGDGSVYDTLVRLGQSWVMRYPMIDPQGNFGSIDGDPPAAYRYTECRLTRIASEMLRDIDENTVDFVPNYKESTTEPSVLPSAVPNLLMNGSTGIAVGMTTNIPPHNLGELIDAVTMVIDKPTVEIDEIMKVMPGPDFPTGGAIVGRKGIESYMKTGRGIVKVRGTVHVEDLKQGKEQIVITEIPYNVNRAAMVQKIAELVHDKVIEGISDLRDESDSNTRIVIELKRGEVARPIVNKLFKHTQLESSFGVIMLALVDKRPREMNIREMIEQYIDHRRDVVYRRTLFRKEKAEARAHILEGLKIALDNLDDFVRIIRASSNREEAKVALRAKYVLSEKQADAILDMRLYQLTGLERDKIEAEYLDLIKLIAELTEILENEKKLLEVIKKELSDIKAQYADKRLTQFVDDDGEFRMEDLIANEGCIITVTHNGFIKRTPVSDYRSQKRGGKGVIGTGSYEEDFVEHLFTASTHDYVMFFMNNGRVYVEKVYDIPEGSRIAKGRSIVNVLEMQKDERLATILTIKDFADTNFLVMATKKGIVKRTNLAEYQNYRKGGIIGINIDEGDELIGAKLTKDGDDLVIITRVGQSIRFRADDSELRPISRATRGVKGITLREDTEDYVVTIEVVNPAEMLLVAGMNGQGKRTPFDEYPQQHRGGIGVIAIKTAGVAGALSVHETDEIMLLTQSGQAVRTRVSEVRPIGRTTMGVRLINLAEGDHLIGVSKVVEVDEEEA
jgi:DNA gyrase subunit A